MLKNKYLNPVLTDKNHDFNKKKKKLKTPLTLFILLRSIPWITFIFILAAACNTTEPPPVIPPKPEKTVILTVEDFSLTEVWLKLTTKNLSNDKSVQIFRDGKAVFNFHLTAEDTVVVQDSLKPATAYNYSSTIIESESDTVKSKTINAATMDTTSQDFTWEIFTFGGGDPSVLRDIAIINENDIWAVGEIHTAETDKYDSNGVWVQHYNALHWDGLKWELRRVNGNDSPIYTILVFSGDDIWFNGLLHWDGANFSLHNENFPLESNGDGWRISSVYGTSSRDFYVVGEHGNIAHYNGTNWQKINSGTELTLTDIYGTSDGGIYACGADLQFIKGIILINNESNNWETIIISEVINESELFTKLYGSIATIWLDERHTLYSAGTFLYQYKKNRWDFVTSFPNNFIHGNPIEYRGYITSIRGNKSNDWVFCGERNTIYHFNGSTWKQLGLLYDPSSSLIWGSIEQKENIIVAVGFEGRKAKLIFLKR